MTIQETGGTQKSDRGRRRGGPRHAAGRRPGAARDRAGLGADAGAAMRRLATAIPASPPIRRWARRSISWSRMAAPRSCPRRRRSTAPSICSPAAPRPRGRREADRAHQLVGGLHRAATTASMNNNPSPGNKAGGLTTILEKSLGAAAKGGTTTLTAVYRLCRAGDGQGLRLHGHARLRPGLGDRPGRGRRQYPLLHHRPRLGLWLQADAVDQARHQHADVSSA